MENSDILWILEKSKVIWIEIDLYCESFSNKSNSYVAALSSKIAHDFYMLIERERIYKSISIYI